MSALLRLMDLSKQRILIDPAIDPLSNTCVNDPEYANFDQ